METHIIIDIGPVLKTLLLQAGSAIGGLCVLGIATSLFRR